MFKRMAALFAAVCVLLGALLWRTLQVGVSQTAQAAKQTHTRTLIVGTSRGVIYDRELQALAPSDERLLAAVAPCEAARETLTAAFGAQKAAQMLQSGAPCLAEAKTSLQTEFARTFSVPVRRGASALAAHLIGTLDGTDHGVSGLEKAFDPLLTAHSGSLSVRFFVDANGRVLPGLDKEILDRNYCSAAGIALTIDSEVQRITQAALKESRIESGCAVVANAETGEILAMASVPAQTPGVNKALCAYSVGSVFKPLVAAFALEHGISERFSCTCAGTCQIGDTVFSCFGKKAHGTQTMRKALENSCNTYFIRLMQEIDANDFLSFCASLGFGAPLALCEELVCDGGSLPQKSDLLLPGERANLAFGQGKLLASPVQLLSLYQMLATGVQMQPGVVRGFVDENSELTEEPPASGVRRLSAATVKRLRKLLSASAAAAKTVGAGKTGTAQSGIFENGKEVCRTWFAGFYPADEPRFTVVILNENGVSGAADCAPVFRAICEGLHETF